MRQSVESRQPTHWPFSGSQIVSPGVVVHWALFTHWTQTLLNASPGGYRQSIAYGAGMFIASVPGEFTTSNYGFSIGTYASTDGIHWKANGGSIDERRRDVDFAVEDERERETRHLFVLRERLDARDVRKLVASIVRKIGERIDR